MISIIMPLYNAERFLEETLVSVSKQIFQDYELICINDGSDDDTVNIVQRFQKADSRIKLLSNEKRFGAAVARNKGIKAAQAKYLIFLDGDDVFDEEMLLFSFNKAEEHNADIVVFEYMHTSSEDIYNKQIVAHSIEYVNRFCRKPISINDIKVYDFLNWSSSPCNKLFRREFIDLNHLEFQNIPSDNDTYFVDMAFFLAKRIIFLDSPKVMLYAREHFTPGRISTERDPMCLYCAMIKVKDELKQRGMFSEMHKIYHYRAFYYMLTGLKNAKNDKTREDFLDFLVNKGFDNLLAMPGRECGIDLVLENKKNELVKSGLKEGWEQIDSIYEICLEENIMELRAFFSDCRARNMKIGVWGIGENGKKFLIFCNKYRLDIDIIFDKDERKYGMICEGYQIQPPENVSNVEIIITTLSGDAYDSVKQMVHSFNNTVKVISLNFFLCVC